MYIHVYVCVLIGRSPLRHSFGTDVAALGHSVLCTRTHHIRDQCTHVRMYMYAHTRSS